MIVLNTKVNSVPLKPLADLSVIRSSDGSLQVPAPSTSQSLLLGVNLLRPVQRSLNVRHYVFAAHPVKETRPIEQFRGLLHGAAKAA